MAEHNLLGQWGEAYAARYLQEKGFQILERNYRMGKAEVDLIVQKTPGVLVVVEVKTRTGQAFGLPQTFATRSKIKMMIKAAHAYVRRLGVPELEVRFDIVAIVKNGPQVKIEHLEDAFYAF